MTLRKEGGWDSRLSTPRGSFKSTSDTEMDQPWGFPGHRSVSAILDVKGNHPQLGKSKTKNLWWLPDIPPAHRYDSPDQVKTLHGNIFHRGGWRAPVGFVEKARV